MEQWIKNKFECKIRLRNAITEKYISKGNYEWILKYILKSNLFLVKHYPLIKDFTDKMMNECNELLSLDFFMNEKILIIWIARELNHYIKIYPTISEKLTDYLIERRDSMKHWDNKYHNRLGKRTLISCDNRCFQDYLPSQNAKYYGSFDEEKDKKYIELDESNLYYRTLNKNELLNIKEFRICVIDEDLLKQEVTDNLNEFKKIKDGSYYTGIYDSGVDKIFRSIKWFEKIEVYGNCGGEFGNLLRETEKYYSSHLYDLMKNDKFHYNVNDDFFIIDRDDRDLICEVDSTNYIGYLIDLPLWIGYMQSHDILDLSEMYLEENFVDTIYN